MEGIQRRPRRMAPAVPHRKGTRKEPLHQLLWPVELQIHHAIHTTKKGNTMGFHGILMYSNNLYIEESDI